MLQYSAVAPDDIPERVKEFIFSDVDSVEQLEVLFKLRSEPSRAWNSEALSNELRSSPDSVKQRLERLASRKSIEESPQQPQHYLYRKGSSEYEGMLNELFDAYQTRRHRILELIFSPMKKARRFADAFRLSGGDDNG